MQREDPPRPDMKSFNQQVWKIARQIPPGKVFTYGQIAKLIPAPRGITPEAYQAQRSRWVGAAMAQCPKDVPWQRVVNAQGKISLSNASGQATQRILLEAEGIQFNERQRIELARYGWDGPTKDWLIENGLLAPTDEPQMGLPF